MYQAVIKFLNSIYCRELIMTKFQLTIPLQGEPEPQYSKLHAQTCQRVKYERLTLVSHEDRAD